MLLVKNLWILLPHVTADVREPLLKCHGIVKFPIPIFPGTITVCNLRASINTFIVSRRAQPSSVRTCITTLLACGQCNVSSDRKLLFQSDSLDVDEPGAVNWLQATNDVHRALIHVIQLLSSAASAESGEVSFVYLAPDSTVDGLLRSNNASFQELPLGGEVKPVVQNPGIPNSDKLVTERTDLPVEGKTLKVDVGRSEDSETWGLIASPGLDTDEPVFNNVDTANTVPAGNGVGGEEELNWVSDRLSVLILELHGDTILKVNSEVFWHIWGVLWVDGKLPHVLWWGRVGVLEDSGLIRAVGHVLVHRPWLCLSLGDGDANLGGVVEKVITALEAGVELGNSPWGDNLDIGLEGIEGKLKTDLVIAFTRAAVGDGNTTLSESNSNLGTGNDGTSERGS